MSPNTVMVVGINAMITSLEVAGRFHRVKQRVGSRWLFYRLRYHGYGVVIVNTEDEKVTFPFGDRSYEPKEMLNFLNGYERALEDVNLLELT